MNREKLFNLINSYLLGERSYNEVTLLAKLKKVDSYHSLKGLKIEYDEMEVDPEGVTAEENERINTMIYEWVDATIAAEKRRKTYFASYSTSCGTEPIMAFSFTNKRRAISIIRDIGISNTTQGGSFHITVSNDEDGERFEKLINVK